MSGNAARVQSAVQNLEYLLGNTRTGEALDYAKTNVLRRARPGASQVNYFTESHPEQGRGRPGRGSGRGRGRPRTGIFENFSDEDVRGRQFSEISGTSEDEDGEDVDVLRRPDLEAIRIGLSPFFIT